MRETYQDIIDEIGNIDFEVCAKTYCINHHLHRDAGISYHETAMALDIAARVREAVGGDPDEWWMQCNDDKVKIGDVFSMLGEKYLVKGFFPSGVVFDGFDGELTSTHKDNVHKVIAVPYTRDKIIDEAISYLKRSSNEESVREILEVTVNRAMNLRSEDESV